MGRIDYDQSIGIGSQKKVIQRKEYFGEDSLWHKFKLSSAVLLWLLCLVLMIAGSVWFYSRFYFDGLPPLPPLPAATSTMSSKPPATRVVMPPAPIMATSPVVMTSPPSVIKVEIPKIEVEVKTPPPLSVPTDPTANMTPEERRQYRVWVLRE